jgi:hypothetical protein
MRFHNLINHLTSANECAPRAQVRRRRGKTSSRRCLLEFLEERRLLSFNPAVNYAVAAEPLDVVAADLNGDGSVDFATVSSTEITIMLGIGDGNFRPPQMTSVGSGICAVAAGDFNADGALDLAVTANSRTWDGSSYITEGAILVFLGNGNGTFQPAKKAASAVGTSLGALAVADFNGDGNADIAAAHGNGSSVHTHTKRVTGTHCRSVPRARLCRASQKGLNHEG